MLGGGGVTGIAWETGFMAGLNECGFDGRGVDLMVGTSAGSTVAAQISSGVGVDVLLDAQLDPLAGIEPVLNVDIRAVLSEIDRLWSSTDDPLEGCRRVGAFALDADVPPERERLDIVRRRLPSHEWPDSPLTITAVDALTGELLELDRGSGIGLVEAVAASCAIPGVWPAVSWGARRLIDGGVRSGTNADVASSCDRVLVLQVIAEEAAHASREGKVLTIEPDDDYRSIAADAMDPSARPVAARIGREHAKRLAGEIETFWNADELQREDSR